MGENGRREGTQVLEGKEPLAYGTMDQSRMKDTGHLSILLSCPAPALLGVPYSHYTRKAYRCIRSRDNGLMGLIDRPGQLTAMHVVPWPWAESASTSLCPAPSQYNDHAQPTSQLPLQPPPTQPRQPDQPPNGEGARSDSDSRPPSTPWALTTPHNPTTTTTTTTHHHYHFPLHLSPRLRD